MSRAVLIVDDDDGIRECLAELLAAEGYDVAEARDGYEGLRALDATQPAVVVLDLMMPVLNGWQFLDQKRHRRADVSSIPVVVVTASEQPRVEADLVLRKPFEFDVFLAAVTRLAMAPS